MKYTEQNCVGNKFRADYRNDIEAFVGALCEDGKRLSVENASRFKAEADFQRASLASALGWPLNTESIGKAELEEKIRVTEEDGIEIYRTVFRVFSKIRFYGMLFVHKGGEKRPFVISQHGGLGTPELCSSVLEGGSSNYNGMTQRILRLGANVLAPQLLLWDPKAYDSGLGEEGLQRRELDSRLKLYGSSIAALEIGALKQCIGFFCDEPYVADNKIGMAGLSYGGFYTLYTAALDKRIKAAISCSFFGDRDKYPWSDWAWKPENGFFLDPEVSLLAFPRSLCIAVGSKDELFDVKYAEAELERLRLMSEKAFGNTDWLKICVFDGTHEFIKDSEPLEWLISRLEK